MDEMSMKAKLRRLIGLIEGHEDKVAEQVSKRTSMDKKQAKDRIYKIQEKVNKDSNVDNRDRNQR
ncbi:hypothetical protein [Halalkalicoccus ordinarius]|uniref:hypothetical protein n=1 Tax=Halalkalicoccus ordinarius TaxID=3116651 RepID=UPI00300F1C7F